MKAARIVPLQEKRRSSVYRIVTEASGRSVIAKRSRIGRALRERLLYESILPRIPLRAAACLGFLAEDPPTGGAGDGDPAEPSGWLFLEDLGSSPFDPWRADHQALAARWLAAFHAAASGLPAALTDPLEERMLPRHRDHMTSARMRATALASAPDCGVSGRETLHQVGALCDDLESRWGAFEREAARLPHTLIHGDCVPRNLLIGAGEDGPVLVPIDWGSAGIGFPGADLGQTTLIWDGPRPDPDRFTYLKEARRRWPDLREEDVRLMTTLGCLFSTLYVVDMELAKMEYPASNRPKHLASLGIYLQVLRGARPAP